MIENGPGTQCRLCTSTAVGQIVEIFGEDGRTRNLAKKIEECLPISVARGDLFPKTVCLLCLDKLEQFHVFRESCIKSELSFEAKWKDLHPHQNIQFPLEPECCLQEVDNESAPPVVRNHPTPEGLFRLEIIPQYNVPKKTEAAPGGFNLMSVSPNNFKQNHFKTSTPIQRPYGGRQDVSSPRWGPVPTPQPRIGLPSPDDYILVKEETIALDDDASENSNNLVEFYDAGGKDLDIVLEQKRRHAVLPPMWDVYEKVITVERTQARLPEPIVAGVRSDKTGGFVDNNENSIIDKATDSSTKDDAKEPACKSPMASEYGQVIKTEPRMDYSENSRTESALVESTETTMPHQGEKKDPKPALKITHRRYIISKEAFPCSLCGSCFLVNQGFEREIPTTPDAYAHRTHANSYENDINYLNNTPEDRKLYNLVRAQNNCQTQWPAVEISRKYSPPVMPATKHNKPNVALTAKKSRPAGFDAFKKALPKKVPMPFTQITHMSSPITPKPEFTQTVVNTKHQFVSQVIKREPTANDEGVSVTSEDIDDFNSLVIKNFYCEMCNKYFPRRSSLKRHQRTHASDKVFSCPRCTKAFSRKEHLSRHMLLHTEARPFQCQVCMKKYTRKEHVERHILIHPQIPELEFRARKLDKMFDSEARHFGSLGLFKGRGGGGTVKLERPYVCELCNHGFARREHLQRHKKRMHRVTTGKVEGGGPGTDESKPYSCPKCLKTFTRKEHLVRHNKIHLREVVLHTGQLPPGLNLLPAMLQLPPKSVMGLEARPALSITRASDVAARIPCDRLPGLDVSLSVIESSKKNHPAFKDIPLLPNKLDISISLVKEQPTPPPNKPSTSNGPIRVKQEFMPKKFQLPVALLPEKTANAEPIPAPNISHLGTSEEHLMNFLKPFNCEYCANKRFTRKSHLVRHFKRIHPERDSSLVGGGSGELKSEPPVEFDSETFVSNADEHLCKICNKNFSRRYHLNRHLKLHLLDKSGKLKEIEDDANKPFKCSSCNERFAKYEGFQNHRCTGTEVGSMVLVGSAELAAGSDTSVDTPTECKPPPRSANRNPPKGDTEGKTPGPSKGKTEPIKNSLGIHTMISKITLKRNSTGSSGANTTTGKNPAKRDRRKVSRNCYECEVCGANFALKKLVNKHMLTHGIDVENESDGGENAGGSTVIPQ